MQTQQTKALSFNAHGHRVLLSSINGSYALMHEVHGKVKPVEVYTSRQRAKARFEGKVKFINICAA